MNALIIAARATTRSRTASLKVQLPVTRVKLASQEIELCSQDLLAKYRLV